MRRATRAATGHRVLATAALAWSIAAPAPGGACEQSFDSTFALIRAAIFERRGCTAAPCHDAASAAGGLDLTAADLYDRLVDAPVTSVVARPGVVRVSPAKKEHSLLWLNLAAATLPGQWQAPLRPMPLGGLPPLTLDELEVVQRWIEAAAPRDGVVPGTGELLDACLPPPGPLTTRPLDPPPPGVGVQLRAPRQVLAPHSEREVCFVTWYDLTDRVPPQYRGPDGTTFRYKRLAARQDPLSHHAVVIPYGGATPIDSPLWGPFTCGGGDADGAACAPTDAAACPRGVCASRPTPSVACIGYGPGDASIGVGNDSLFNTMAAGLGAVEGVYAEAPLRGILVWNSHAFNLTDQPGKLDIWVNLEFAAPAEQRYRLQRFTEVIEQFRLAVPAFGAQELCAHYVVPADAAIIELSSHNHRRGRRFRIWEGAFACAGGALAGRPCSPVGVEPGLGLDDPCAGAPCTARRPVRVGDCDGDQRVTVAEILQGVNIALDQAPLAGCPGFDGDADQRVDVAELLAAVDLLLAPDRDADASLLYTSLTYADPAVARFDPPLRLGGPTASAADRTLSYCALYDNGASDPADVKRRSSAPLPTAGFPGGPCRAAVGCTAGRVAAACAVDADCDTAPGAGDGACDACPVGFGTTTEDEMFVLLGAYYRQ